MAQYTVPDGQIVPGVFLNPGSGDLRGGTADQARRNMYILLHDAGLTPIRFYRCPRLDDGGRFAFSFRVAGERCVVHMPGWPLGRVRYTGAPGQNPWNFPRLYLDDSSWLWKFAVDILSRRT